MHSSCAGCRSDVRVASVTALLSTRATRTHHTEELRKSSTRLVGALRTLCQMLLVPRRKQTKLLTGLRLVSVGGCMLRVAFFHRCYSCIQPEDSVASRSTVVCLPGFRLRAPHVVHARTLFPLGWPSLTHAAFDDLVLLLRSLFLRNVHYQAQYSLGPSKRIHKFRVV